MKRDSNLYKKRSGLCLGLAFAVAGCGGAAPAPDATAEQKAREMAAANAQPKAVAPALPTPPPEKDPWEGRTDLFVAPVVHPSTKVDLGEVARSTLSNGLTVIAVPRHQVPAVDLTIAIRAGDNQDPLDKTGVASFAAQMLRRGTEKRTADEISESIDFVGGSLGAGTKEDTTLISCHVRSKDIGLCLDLVSDIALHASFPEKEMDEVRDQLIASVEGTKDNAEALAKQHVENLVYGDDDVRGRAPTKRTISSIDRATLVAFRDAWFAPNNAEIAIAGDFDAATVKAQLEKAFGAWKKKTVAPQPPRTMLAPPKEMLIRLVDKPDATQSAIQIAGAGIAHKSRDYYAVTLMNFTLGGGAFSSRLMKVVRSEGAKTYGARSHFSAHRDPEAFYVETFTRNSETAATIKLLLGEVDRMKKTGSTDAELDAAKGNLIGGFGLRLQTASDIAEELLVADMDGLDAQYVEKLPERLAAVTRDDVARVAGAYLSPTAMAIVSKAKEVRPQLEKEGWKVADVVSYTDAVSPAERKGPVRTFAAEAGDTVGGKKLLDAAMAAQGGAALGKIKSMHLSGKGTLTVQGQSVPLSVEEYVILGKSRRVEIDIGPGMAKILQVASDGKGFQKMEGPMGDKTEDMAADRADDLLWDANTAVLRASQPGAKVTALPSTTIDGKSYDTLQVTAGKQIYKLLLDGTTHLPARLMAEEEGVASLEVLSDWRKEGGVQIAHKVEGKAGPQAMSVSYDKVVLDGTIAPELFKK